MKNTATFETATDIKRVRAEVKNADTGELEKRNFRIHLNYVELKTYGKTVVFRRKMNGGNFRVLDSRDGKMKTLAYVTSELVRMLGSEAGTKAAESLA